MAYMAGLLNGMLAPFMAGAHIIEGPLFSPETALDFWRRPMQHDVNTLQITPTIASALCRLTRGRDVAEEAGRRIVQVQCTSAPIPSDIRRRFLEKFSLPLQDCYGITELGGPLTFQRREDAIALNDFTTPADEIELEIRQNDDRAELWIHSPFGMLGYLEDDGYVQPFDENGFMDTGDLGVISDGRLEITGRKKDIIIRGGVNVSPVRLESLLSTVPGVDEAAVLGSAHSFWGEQIVAFVVPVPGAKNVGEAVQRFCREHLGVAERPDEIRIIDRLPRSFIGKIEKNALRKLLQDV
jgi:long-chain acyl-CoA synthetase